MQRLDALAGGAVERHDAVRGHEPGGARQDRLGRALDRRQLSAVARVNRGHPGVAVESWPGRDDRMRGAQRLVIEAGLLRGEEQRRFRRAPAELPVALEELGLVAEGGHRQGRAERVGIDEAAGVSNRRYSRSATYQACTVMRFR